MDLPTEPLRELALFAGAGGGLLGSILNGWRTVCAVEIEPYCREVLLQRQRDGCLEKFPIWDDVRTFDGRPWRGCVDIVTGGFPCQDISLAGTGDGLEGERSGLWREMRRIVGEVGPRFVLVENSPALLHRGIGIILWEMAEMGFNAEWGCLSAERVGGPIERERIFIAFTDRKHGQARLGHQSNRAAAVFGEEARERNAVWLQARPSNFRVGNGVADYLGRVRAIGNGQVPAVVRAAWEILNQ